MPELQRRAVAGSFILRFPDNDTSKKPQVALFRRSANVRTYPQKYAPISGSVETSDATPLATAWRELQEETSLTSSSLRLFRQGKPYTFADASVGREWTINPFAFVLAPGIDAAAAIRLDWEHDSYAWFDPDAVSASDAFGGVPRLLDSLRRVWFDIDLGGGAGRALGDGLLALQRDHASGARQLAGKALDVFVDVIPRLDAGERDVWWRNVRYVGWHLWKNGRESMGAPILSVVLSSLAIIEERLPSGSLPPGFVDDVVGAIKELAERRQTTSSKTSQQFTSFLTQHYPNDTPVKILTLSSSSTIASSLKHALSQHALDIRVLESRPLFEGADMAKDIASSTHKPNITVYTDASAGVAAQDADIVLLGADLIDKAGNVSNKTGSLPAVLAAKHISPGVKVVVLAGKDKVLPYDPPGHEENDPEEISVSWKSESTAAVDVKNVYFEWVDAALIDHYVTEDGITTSEGIAATAEDVKRLADRFFADL